MNVLQTSLTQAVATNRPITSQTISSPEPVRAVQQSDMIDAIEHEPSDNSRQTAHHPTLVAEDTALGADDLATKFDAKLEYDRDTRSSPGAIAQYLQHQYAAKREEIQQMVGVDIYV